MSPSKRLISSSKIPSIKQLCESLGFQYASVKDTNTFMEETRAWRKSYEARSGREASDLLRWNDAGDQRVLADMAQAFIDPTGLGERFWSPGRGWGICTDLYLPADREKIVALLKQLFWRQNRYAFLNSQYGHGHKTPEPRGVAGQNSASILESIEPTPDQVKNRTPRLSPTIVPKSTTVVGTSQKTTLAQDLAQDLTIQSPEFQPIDIFEVPDDSDYEPSNSLKRQRPDTGPSKPRKTKKLPKLPKEPVRAGRATRATRVTKKNIDNGSDHQFVPFVPEQIIEAGNPTQDAQAAHPNQLLALSDSFSPDPSSLRSEMGIDLHKGSTIGTAQVSAGEPFKASIAPMGIPMIPGSTSWRTASTKRLPQSRSEIPAQTRAEDHDAVRATDSLDHGTSQIQASITRPDTQLLLEIKRVTMSESTDGPARPRSSKQSLSTAESNTILGGDISPQMNAQETTSISPKESTIMMSPSFEAQENTGSAKIKNLRPEKPASKPIPIDTSYVAEHSKDSVLVQPRDSKLQPFQKSTVRDTWSRDGSTDSYLTPQPRTEVVQPSQVLPPRSSSSKPRTKTSVPLWIITREPRYTEELWDEGVLQGTTLSAFIDGISKVTQRNHIEKIRLTLRAPTADTKITVFNDAEDSWESGKAIFAEKLKEAWTEAKARRKTESLSFKILIEPFYEGGSSLSGVVDEDEEEFIF